MIEFVYRTLEAFGFTHPLHPAMTHIPMGMVMGGFAFALIAFVFRKKILADTAHHCYTLALLGVWPTMLLGYMDWHYKWEAEWSNLVLMKIILATIFTILLFVAFFVGRKEQVDLKKKIFVYGLCLAVATGLGYTGGEFNYG